MRKAIVTAGRIALVCAIVLTSLTGFGVQTALAQEFAGYTSGVQIANLSLTATATVTLNAYNADGSSGGSPLTDQIPANSSKNYFPISNVQAGFSGSIVVGSNQSVAGIVNVLAIVGNTAPAGAAYIGRSEGNTTVLLPLLNYNNSGYYTWYSVQNAGSAAATVQVRYSDGTSIPDLQIPPGAAKVIYQKSEGALNHAKNFAGTLTSNQPIVASVIQENPKTMFAYTGFGANNTSTNPVLPLINANNSGYVTGVQLQNAGATATDVTLSYTPAGAGNGSPCTETRRIEPGAATNFALAAFDPNVPADPAVSNCAKVKFIGSAKVTANSANMPLVGLVNQLLPNINGGAYGAFTAADAGKSVSMPLIMDRNSGYNTGFNVQNVGANPVNVTCTFQPTAQAPNPAPVAATLQPDQALNALQFNTLGEKYVGAATCTGDAADSLLVAVVNELKPGNIDNLLVYEGVKLP
jgi:hypothetical protein